jgi:hypothetical protein
MQQFLVTGPKAVIACGTVVLTDEQADRRISQIEPLGKGHYNVLQPLEFKQGETLGWDGDPGKGSPLTVLDDPEEEEDSSTEEPEFYAIIKGFTRRGVAYEPGQVLELPLLESDIARLLAEGKIEGPVDMQATLAGPVVDEHGNPLGGESTQTHEGQADHSEQASIPQS